MGLFDGLKLAKDLIKGGIASVKACDKLDELVEKSQDDYEDVLSPAEKQLYREYKELYDRKEEEEDIDRQNEMTEGVEAAEVAYLLALTKNGSLPKSFRDQIAPAVEEYRRTNDLPYEIVEKRLRKMAKDDEERAFVDQLMEEVRKDES